MLRAAQRSSKRASTLSKAEWNVARVLVVLRGGEPTAAMDYLRRGSRGKDRAAVVTDTVEAELRTWWRESSWGARRLLINVEGADRKKKWAIGKARRFLAECNLDMWAEWQNMSKGITPMSSLVLAKGNHELRIYGVACARTRKAGFQWLRRWRRRHGVRLKRLRPCDAPRGEELREKARVRGQPRSHRFRGRGQPISGSGRCRVQKTGDRFSVHFLGPRLRVAKENGPGKRPRFFKAGHTVFGFLLLPDCKATAVWRWTNYLHRCAEGDKQVVLVNFDETSVKLVPEEKPGFLSEAAHRLSVTGKPMGRRIARSATRACLTHLAAICTCPDIQKELPHIILIGEKQMSEERFQRLQADKPNCVHIWREQKAWVTIAVMQRYVRLLGRCLRAYRRTHRFIVFFDVFAAHIAPALLRNFALHDFWVCLIPARMTWALQPADTHLFATYKRKLAEEWQRRGLVSATGHVQWEGLLAALWRVIEGIMNATDWRRAFASDGLTAGQTLVSSRTLGKLGLAPAGLMVPAEIPTLVDLNAVSPTRREPPLNELFLGVERLARGIAPVDVEPARPPARPLGAASSHEDRPWFGRLRSTSALVLPAPEAPATPPAPWPTTRDPSPPPLPPPPRPPYHPPTTPSSTAMPE